MIELTSIQAGASAFDADDEILWDGDYLAYVVAAQSYRWMRRFITHHVAPHADSRIWRLLNLDAQARAQAIFDDSGALDAWAVAIWSADLDRDGPIQHWSELTQQEFMRGSSASALLDRESMGMTLTVKAPDGPLRVGQANWMLHHAALAILRNRFARARALAAGMARAGDVELGLDMRGPNNLALTGEVLDDGGLRFTVQESMKSALTPRPHRTKAQRRAAAEELRKQRFLKLMRICTGPCLRFSWRDGWGVATSTTPDRSAGADIRRLRLFAAGRPAFILFTTSTGWCARMVGVPLEAHDDLAWKVIDTLRHAYARYRKQQDARAREAARLDPALPALL